MSDPKQAGSEERGAAAPLSDPGADEYKSELKETADVLLTLPNKWAKAIAPEVHRVYRITVDYSVNVWRAAGRTLLLAIRVAGRAIFGNDVPRESSTTSNSQSTETKASTNAEDEAQRGEVLDFRLKTEPKQTTQN